MLGSLYGVTPMMYTEPMTTTHGTTTTIDGATGDVAVVVSPEHTYVISISPYSETVVTIDGDDTVAMSVGGEGPEDIAVAMAWVMARYAEDVA